MRRSLPSSSAGVRGPPLRVTAGAAVAHPDVQEAVGAEDDVATVVVGVRLVDLQQPSGLGGERAGRVDGVLLDDRVAVDVGVVDVREAAGGIERQAEQALFAPAGHLARHVEHGRRPVVADANDRAGLVDDEGGVVVGAPRHVDRVVERADLGEGHGGGVARRRGPRWSPSPGRLSWGPPMSSTSGWSTTGPAPSWRPRCRRWPSARGRRGRGRRVVSSSSPHAVASTRPTATARATLRRPLTGPPWPGPLARR